MSSTFSIAAKTLAIAIVFSGLTQSCIAQEEEEAPATNYIYGTYYNCSGGALSRADEITAKDAAVWNKLVEDGALTGWGYYAHHTGGQWQRLNWYSANSMEQLLDGGDAADAAFDEAYKALSEEEKAKPGFGSICNRHDDYIWSRNIGKQREGESKAAFSVYYLCDVSRETRADEIVKEHMAPIFDKLVDEGKLTSWGWASHEVGGWYRKLQTMTGPDHKSVLKARAEGLAAVYAEGNKLGEELTEICGTHSDYMWNVVH